MSAARQRFGGIRDDKTLDGGMQARGCRITKFSGSGIFSFWQKGCDNFKIDGGMWTEKKLTRYTVNVAQRTATLIRGVRINILGGVRWRN